VGAIGGQTDYLQHHFSIAHDEARILALLRDYPAGYPAAVSLNGTDWSAPVAAGAGSGQIRSPRSTWTAGQSAMHASC